MNNNPRRSFLKTLGALSVLFSVGSRSRSQAMALPKTTDPLSKNRIPLADQNEHSSSLIPSQNSSIPTALEVTTAAKYPPGFLSIVQGPTSDTETLINIFVPRLKNYAYAAVDSKGVPYLVERYERVEGPGFYHIDKLRISGLVFGVKYKLKVMDRKSLVDERFFGTLNLKKTNPNFAFFSCMSDDYRFSEVIEPMWNRLLTQQPEFLILTGDLVYVDSFDFVERQKANEFDLWQRYTDAFARIPLYHWSHLVPVFATWDDHDFGTNDGDRDFQAKEAAARLRNGFFGGPELPGVWTQGPYGVSSVLTAFGQRFFLMDDRSFRQPNRNQNEREAYGHWGQSQHDWLLHCLSENDSPAWIINGNQCFNGVALEYKEAFEDNHPKEFVTLIEQLKSVRAPVLFGSGDVHLSEIMRVPSDRLGYETYEITSSSMHSYTGTGWENPARMEKAYCKEFNFMMVQSECLRGGLQINLQCLGLPERPYFESSLVVRRS